MGRVSLAVLGQVVKVGVTHGRILGGAGIIFDVGVKGFDSVWRRGVHEVLRKDDTWILELLHHVVNVKLIILWDQFLIVFNKSPVKHILPLIVEVPHHYGRMMLYSPNILSHFNIRIPGIIFIKHRIESARKHHVLPNHDAVLISEFVKPII